MSKTALDQKKGILFASFTALLWGFLAIALKVAVYQIDPITVSWFRFSFALLGLGVFVFFKKEKELSILKKPPVLALLAGLGLCLNYIGYISGIQLTSPNNAQIIIQSAPLLLGVIGVAYFKEKVSKRQMAGFFIAISGFYIFYQNQLSEAIDNETLYNKGTLFVFLAGLSWVVYAVSQKILVKKHSILGINLILFLFATIALTPFINFESILQMSLGMWLLMLFLGMNTLMAYTFLGVAFRYADANRVGMVITLNPLITIFATTALTLMEVSWVDPEILSLQGLIGAFAVIVGAILAVTSK